ncbi:uncharacterized protein LOC100651901 isoform X1 [Bombus terrestris]|uniref:Uncharacterized protein LOC100651901 isoform X1 n=2 Tax=Bombus terrestris TaxID=30195 RepID=A0A9B2MTX1_BOMTE|nr:uncharacterized protein LOC100651901 isoform X1 [Bombus terrestris]
MGSSKMSDAAAQELEKQFGSLCIGEETELDINKLNKGQKQAYDNICKLLNEKWKSIITIDAPSGTGKTFLLCTLAVNCGREVKILIFRKDQASEILLKNIQTYTYVSFCMRHFNLQYHEAIQMFRTFSDDKIRELYNLIVYSRKFVVVEDRSVLILDIYTIPSPAMLLLLYILFLKHNLHLLFAGDAMQLHSINKCALHKESNYYIIQILKEESFSSIINLSKNMRICDTLFEAKVANFYKLLQQVQPAGNVPLNYKLRYHLYTQFRPKYLVEERFDTIYIAQTHRNITRRLYRFIEYLKSTGTTYYEVPFCYKLDKTKLPLDTRKYKFFPTLLLVKGYKYIYITEEGVHHVVHLEDILFENNEIKSLIIRFVKDKNRVEIIKRVKLNYYQILPDYRNWLYKNGVIYDKSDIRQFPLRPYTLTYHATIGRTIDEAQIELSSECVYANFLYIGLCSVRHDIDIHKIHDERDLAGYLMTEYMETLVPNKDSEKYYYRCHLDKCEIYPYIVKNTNSEDLDNIEWTTMNDIHKFETSRKNFIRIERSEYEKPNKKVETRYMEITEFVKENPEVILNTMDKIPADDLNNNYNKEKKRKKKGQRQKNEEDKESDALRYLREKYNEWVHKKKK